MDRSYDIFEILPDGTPMWRAAVQGRDAALQKLEALSENCHNEIRLIHLPTKEVVASKPARAGNGRVAF